jgi:hypothetical protein
MFKDREWTCWVEVERNKRLSDNDPALVQFFEIQERLDYPFTSLKLIAGQHPGCVFNNFLPKNTSVMAYNIPPKLKQHIGKMKKLLLRNFIIGNFSDLFFSNLVSLTLDVGLSFGGISQTGTTNSTTLTLPQLKRCALKCSYRGDPSQTMKDIEELVCVEGFSKPPSGSLPSLKFLVDPRFGIITCSKNPTIHTLGTNSSMFDYCIDNKVVCSSVKKLMLDLKRPEQSLGEFLLKLVTIFPNAKDVEFSENVLYCTSCSDTMEKIVFDSLMINMIRPLTIFETKKLSDHIICPKIGIIGNFSYHQMFQ